MEGSLGESKDPDVSGDSSTFECRSRPGIWEYAGEGISGRGGIWPREHELGELLPGVNDHFANVRSDRAAAGIFPVKLEVDKKVAERPIQLLGRSTGRIGEATPCPIQGDPVVRQHSVVVAMKSNLDVVPCVGGQGPGAQGIRMLILPMLLGAFKRRSPHPDPPRSFPAMSGG
jgi:hypothetical protein